MNVTRAEGSDLEPASEIRHHLALPYVEHLRPKRILTQAHMQAQMEAVLDKSRMVDGKQTSLAEHGAQPVHRQARSKQLLLSTVYWSIWQQSRTLGWASTGSVWMMAGSIAIVVCARTS